MYFVHLAKILNINLSKPSNEHKHIQPLLSAKSGSVLAESDGLSWHSNFLLMTVSLHIMFTFHN